VQPVQNHFHVSDRFTDYCQQKTAAALKASIPGFTTVAISDPLPAGLVGVGNDWSRRLFDGSFYRSAPAGQQHMPAVSLVFVQSSDGNTGAEDPSTLGGGETDKHLVYEGLSRVEADAVLAGAATAADDDVVFSVWHPEFVRLRAARGLPRHPVQIILTGRGHLPIERALVYNEPALRVIVIASTAGAAVLERPLRARPWIEVIDAGEPVDLRRALSLVYERRITVISAIGGRRAAAALFAANVVGDLYLTTAPHPGGEPNTPLFTRGMPPHQFVLEKAGEGIERGVRFQHVLFRG
jgi:riboflavin biosynthesis pyrimidine reductase